MSNFLQPIRLHELFGVPPQSRSHMGVPQLCSSAAYPQPLLLTSSSSPYPRDIYRTNLAGISPGIYSSTMRHHARLLARDDDDVNCGTGGGDRSDTGLRIASIFIILVGSLAGALFPVLTRRTKWLSKRVPQPVFETAKYFGSGVIVRGELSPLLAHPHSSLFRRSRPRSSICLTLPSKSSVPPASLLAGKTMCVPTFYTVR